jgi:hypothetical protein
MKTWVVLFCAMVVCLASAASAQVIYEPVRYQYGSEGSRYYYGGTDPAVFRQAQRDTAAAQAVTLHRPVDAPLRVYSDDIPLQNAAVFGLTPDDARNQANRLLPRYFVKRELVAEHAVDGPHGELIVPARPVKTATVTESSIDIKPYQPAAKTPATRPTTEPAPLLIIPKDMLDRPLEEPRPSVAMAQ